MWWTVPPTTLWMAEGVLAQALRDMRGSVGTTDPALAQVLWKLALARTEQDKHKEAEPLYRECFRIEAATMGEAHGDSVVTLAALNDCILAQDNDDIRAPRSERLEDCVDEGDPAAIRKYVRLLERNNDLKALRYMARWLSEPDSISESRPQAELRREIGQQWRRSGNSEVRLLGLLLLQETKEPSSNT